jgi:hypothetical protein
MGCGDRKYIVLIVVQSTATVLIFLIILFNENLEPRYMYELVK